MKPGFWTASAGAALVLALVGACGDDDDVSQDTYTSDAHRYSISYPDDWTVTNGSDDDTFAAPDGVTEVLVEFGPGPELAADDPRLEDEVEEAAVGHNEGVTDYVTLGVREFTGADGLVVEWRQEIDDVPMYRLQVWVPNGDSSWYVTMTTPTDTKDDYEATFQDMLDSFKPSE